MQSSTTPDPGYQWESDKLTVDTRVGVIKIVIVINCNLITFSEVIACNCN